MADFQWVEAEVSLTETPDGGLILQNKTPLADYPANLVSWLHQNATKIPDKPFLEERVRRGEGWILGLDQPDSL